MQKYVKRIGDERLKKVPANLDLKPYRDEYDFDLLKRMQEAIDRGRARRRSTRRGSSARWIAIAASSSINCRRC